MRLVSIIRVKLEALEANMPTYDDIDTLRDMRDMCQYWYHYAKRNRADHATRQEYLGHWDTLSELVLALR